MSTKGAIFLAIILFFVAVFLVSKFDKKNPKTQPDRIEIITMAEQFVKQVLKAPSTADFCSTREATLKNIGSDEYEVTGYVDAQNSFGAMLRNNYYVKLKYNPGKETYNLLDIKVE